MRNSFFNLLSLPSKKLHNGALTFHRLVKFTNPTVEIDSSTAIIYKQTRASLVGKLRATAFAVELLKVQAMPVVCYPPHPFLPPVHALVTWSKEIF